MDESFDEKIKKLLEDGKRLGYNPLSPNSIFKDEETSIKNQLVEAFGLNQTGEGNGVDSDLSSPPPSFSRHFNREEGRTVESSAQQFLPTENGNYSLGDLAKEFNELISNDEQHTIYMEGDQVNSQSKEMLRRQKLTNPPYLELALENAQMEATYLSKKLVQANETCAEQKVQFRQSVEELQSKLQEAVSGRRHLLKVHEQEIHEQEEVVSKLQETMKELFLSNQQQESSLLEACEKLNMLQDDKHQLQATLDQVKLFIASQGRKMMPSFVDCKKVENITQQNLITSLQHVFNAVEDENEELKRKSFQFELERNAYREEHNKERMKMVQHELDKQRVVSCTEEMTKNNELRMRYDEQEDKLSMQMKLNGRFSKELAEKNEQYKQENMKHHNMMDAMEKQIINAKCDLKMANDLVKQLQNDKILLDNKNKKQSSLIDDLEMGRIEIIQHQNQIHQLRNQLKEKSSEVVVLRETVSQVHSNLALEINEKVKDVERSTREELSEKIEGLNFEKSKLETKISQLTLNNEETDKQLSEVILERSDLLHKYEGSYKQIEDLNEKLKTGEEKMSQLRDVELNCEKETKKLLVDRSEILKLNQHLQRELETSQLTTKEKEVLLHQANTDLKKVIGKLEETLKKQNDMNLLKHELNDRYHQIRCLENELCTKEKGKHQIESNIQTVLEEKEKYIHLSNERQDKILELTQSKCELEKELVEVRAQVGHLVYEREALDKELKESKQMQHGKIEILKSQMKWKNNELHRVQETLEMLGDESTAMVAAEIQSEVTNKRALVDLLQGELSKSQEKIKTCQRENKKTKKNFFQLVDKFGQLEAELQKMKDELRVKVKKEKGYKIAVERLQGALHKAARRNNHAQCLIDQRYEQITSVNDINQKLLLLNKRTTESSSVTQNWQQMVTSARECLSKFDEADNHHHQTADLSPTCMLVSNTGTSSCTTVTTVKSSKECNGRMEYRDSYGNDLKDILGELRDYMKTQCSPPTTTNVVEISQHEKGEVEGVNSSEEGGENFKIQIPAIGNDDFSPNSSMTNRTHYSEIQPSETSAFSPVITRNTRL